MAREKPSTPPPDPPEICARIRQLREEASVKQHVLGLVSGVPLNTISEIAQGRLPMKRTVLRLAEGCRFLGCDVTGLVESVPTPSVGACADAS